VNILFEIYRIEGRLLPMRRVGLGLLFSCYWINILIQYNIRVRVTVYDDSEPQINALKFTAPRTVQQISDYHQGLF